VTLLDPKPAGGPQKAMFDLADEPSVNLRQRGHEGSARV
jgi:hypothetical protein